MEGRGRNQISIFRSYAYNVQQQTVWWIVFDAYNIITEAALIFIPIYIIGQVQWPISRKVVFSTPFVLRTW